MNRRSNLKSIAAAAVSAAIPASATSHTELKGIQLHVDLNVDPTKEALLRTNFTKTFKPAMMKQKGYMDVKLLKFNSVKKAPGPVNSNYRLLIGFQTEQQRLDWVASADHQKAWPTIDECLRGDKLAATLYDLAL